MTITIHRDILQGTDEWLQLRCGILTASEMSKLITAKTLKPAANDHSRAIVWEKTSQRITGELEPGFMSDDQIRGIEHEPIARDYYRKIQDGVDEVGFITREFDFGVIGCSPDALVGEDGGWEVKCPRAKAHIKTLLTGEVPDEYVMQVQTSLLVSGRKWWDFSSFFAGLDMVTIRVYPDEAIHAAIMSAAEGFEQAVKKNIDNWNNRAQSGARLVPTEKIEEGVEVYLG